jgi:cell division protein FtsZ
MKIPDATPQLLDVNDGASRCRVLVMGVGGAGGNMVNRMAQTWRKGPNTLAVNTDLQALAACDSVRTLAIGAEAARGLGAAGEITCGRLAAEESMSALQEALAGTDLLFLVTGLGGGTGTGACPLIAKAARQMGALTLVFATLPFPFEGDRRRRQAEEGLLALQRVADAVIGMPNDRLLQGVDNQTGLPEAFRQSDAMLAAGIHTMWHLLTSTGIVNLTFADVRELAERSGGTLSFGFAESSGPARSATALRALMESPLLEHGRLLSEAQGLMVNITGGPDLTLADLEGLVGQIAAKARPHAHISMGAVIDPTRREQLTISVLTAESWQEDRFGAGGKSSETQKGDKKPAGPVEAQGELPLTDTSKDRGRFGAAPATLINGEDLDIPTYLRRGVKLSFER